MSETITESRVTEKWFMYRNTILIRYTIFINTNEIRRNKRTVQFINCIHGNTVNTQEIDPTSCSWGPNLFYDAHPGTPVESVQKLITI